MTGSDSCGNCAKTSSPDMPGIWMSRNKTSGLCFVTAASASRPFEHCATTSKSGADSRRISMPRLESASSSTIIVEIFTRELPRTPLDVTLTLDWIPAAVQEVTPCLPAAPGGYSVPRTGDVHRRAPRDARECCAILRPVVHWLGRHHATQGRHQSRSL